MALKGIKPEVVVPSKPKILITGKAGGGKSIFSLNAPSPFYIDTESGATREQYMKKLMASGGTYFGPQQGSMDFVEVLGQIKELATTKHDFKSIVYDSLTKPYRAEQYSAEDRGVSSEFKKSQREAEKAVRKTLSWLMRADLDMTVILICHAKDKWTREGKELIKEVTTWDGPDKLDHDLDLWLETKVVSGAWYATVKKSRIDAFKLDATFPLDFETFKKMYGAAVVDRPIKPIVLASIDQVKEIRRIVELLKFEPEVMEKELTKAGAVELEDLSQEKANEFLDRLNKKLKGESK